MCSTYITEEDWATLSRLAKINFTAAWECCSIHFDIANSVSKELSEHTVTILTAVIFQMLQQLIGSFGHMVTIITRT